MSDKELKGVIASLVLVLIATACFWRGLTTIMNAAVINWLLKKNEIAATNIVVDTASVSAAACFIGGLICLKLMEKFEPREEEESQ